MTEPVTVLGLGPMGQAIARAFVAAGHPTTVWNRTKEKAAPLVAAGATLAQSPATAVSDNLTVICVIDYDATRAVLEQAAPALRGTLVVNLTSGTPDSARATAAWAAERGIDYLDGAIMTPTDTIGTPGAVLLHSGPEESYRGAEGTLAALGGTQTHLGADPGRAAAYDMALLDIFWTSVAGVAHAFALARSEGIAPTDLAPFAKGIGDLTPIIVEEVSTRLTEDRHDGVDANLRSAAAGMSHIVHTSEANGIDAGVLRAAHALARRAVDAGHGDDGLSRLTLTLEEALAARR